MARSREHIKDITNYYLFSLQIMCDCGIVHIVLCKDLKNHCCCWYRESLTSIEYYLFLKGDWMCEPTVGYS